MNFRLMFHLWHMAAYLAVSAHVLRLIHLDDGTLAYVLGITSGYGIAFSVFHISYARKTGGA